MIARDRRLHVRACTSFSFSLHVVVAICAHVCACVFYYHLLLLLLLLLSLFDNNTIIMDVIVSLVVLLLLLQLYILCFFLSWACLGGEEGRDGASPYTPTYQKYVFAHRDVYS